MREICIPCSNLDDIVTRLYGCWSVLKAIQVNAEDDPIVADAIYGAADLLNSICRDFQADIDCSEVQTEKEAVV